MHFFEDLDSKPSDPILGLNTLFKLDSRSEKINLGIGAYKNEEGQVSLFKSVYEAEKMLINEKRSKGYAPIDGDQTFQNEVLKLIYGSEYSLKNYLCAQTIGCTAALHVSARILKAMGISNIHLPEMTWQNHYLVYKSCDVQTHSYPYYNTEKNHLKLDEILSYIDQAKVGNAILFQVSCHNPVGRDPNKAQWRQIAKAIKEKGLFPILDCAYQGFGQGLEQDIYPVKLFSEVFDQYFLCYSFSKNFGLYGERLGAFIAFDRSGQNLEKVKSNVKHWIRACYSSPSIHGSRLVKTILQSQELNKMWQEELYIMQMRLKDLRKSFIESLKKAGIKKNYDYIEEDQGLFSLMGLSQKQVIQLREQQAVYLVENGRLNIAGLSLQNLDKVAQSIQKVLTSHA